MPTSAEKYTPQRVISYNNRQAARVWAVTSAVVFVWVLLIVLPPLFAGFGRMGFASPIYYFFSNICHQMTERSFHLGEHQLAVCSRCFGVYFGLLAGLLIYPLWRRLENIEPLPRKWLLLSIVPMGIDWSMTVFGFWENTHATRFVTGLILGVTCATYILPAVVEIFRNFTLSRRSSS